MKTPISEVYNEDCIEGMKRFPDNYFDLGLIDPPYGIGVTNMKMGGRKTVSSINKSKNWDDKTPSTSFFDELFRVCKNPIIWGGNYFHLPLSQYFCIWDKGETMYGRDFAEMEYAWVKTGGTRIFKKSPNQLDRFHPTQKPVALYTWLLESYAKQGDKILDTHLGSQSSRIAAYKKGFDFVGFEIDKDYFNQGNERFLKSIAMPLFDAPVQPKQLSLI